MWGTGLRGMSLPVSCCAWQYLGYKVFVHRLCCAFKVKILLNPDRSLLRWYFCTFSLVVSYTLEVCNCVRNAKKNWKNNESWNPNNSKWWLPFKTVAWCFKWRQGWIGHQASGGVAPMSLTALGGAEAHVSLIHPTMTTTTTTSSSLFFPQLLNWTTATSSSDLLSASQTPVLIQAESQWGGGRFCGPDTAGS